MMLSSADFEELLPHLFGSARPEIARWEDDGGSRHDVRSVRSNSHLNLIESDQASCRCAHSGRVLMAMTLVVAYTTARAMLAPFGHCAKDYRPEMRGGA